MRSWQRKAESPTLFIDCNSLVRTAPPRPWEPRTNSPLFLLGRSMLLHLTDTKASQQQVLCSVYSLLVYCGGTEKQIWKSFSGLLYLQRKMYILLGGCWWMLGSVKQQALISIKIDALKKGVLVKESEGEEHPSLFYCIYTYLLQWSITHTHTHTSTHTRTHEREMWKKVSLSSTTNFISFWHFFFMQTSGLEIEISPGWVQVQTYIFQKALSLESFPSLSTCSIMYNPDAHQSQHEFSLYCAVGNISYLYVTRHLKPYTSHHVVVWELDLGHDTFQF